MELLKFIAKALKKWAWLPAAIALAGCQAVDPYAPFPDANAPGTSAGTNSMDATSYTLRVGDQLTVNFFDITPVIPPISDQIKEDGTITLIYNEKFQAVGKTISQLQNEVHARYVPAYVKYMTVNIAAVNRLYTVSGEVRAGNSFGYPGHMTVLQAVANAGGFTDYANKRKVRVRRADHRQITVNCVKALTDPDLDIEIFPGDTIYVPTQWW
ncbi:MAG TPA: polysaccharide biosynthesis/export family protein [Verrucomicrobiae bacterium]|jgi:protein involved in polysaccharide export with SLBB domain|nr:polysaccharide biosynthesis/export family protein [Verrucomicrobiae bacterium]